MGLSQTLGGAPEVSSPRLGGSKDLNQPSLPVAGSSSLVSPRSGSCPVPPPHAAPSCSLPLAFIPPEGGQQYEPEPRKGSSPEAQRGGKARGPPTRPPPPPLPGRLRVPCSVLRLWCLGAGLPEQGGQQGWPGREGSTASVEPLEERWKDLREGFQKQKECQRHRPQPGSSPASSSPGCGPRPQGLTLTGGRQYGPDPSLEPHPCPAFSSFLQPSPVLWAA